MTKHLLDRQHLDTGARLRRFLEIERAQMPNPGTRALQAHHRLRPASVIARLAQRQGYERTSAS